jgi:hypothetical protein
MAFKKENVSPFNNYTPEIWWTNEYEIPQFVDPMEIVQFVIDPDERVCDVFIRDGNFVLLDPSGKPDRTLKMGESFFVAQRYLKDTERTEYFPEISKVTPLSSIV